LRIFAGSVSCVECSTGYTSPIHSTTSTACFLETPSSWPPPHLASLNASFAFQCGGCFFYIIEEAETVILSRTGSCASDCTGYPDPQSHPFYPIEIDGCSSLHLAHITHIADRTFEDMLVIGAIQIWHTALSDMTSNTFKGLSS